MMHEGDLLTLHPTSWDDTWALCQQYGPQIVLLTCLSAVTIFRREMSSNHVYAEVRSSTTQIIASTSKKRKYCASEILDCDELLEGAGVYWGAPLMTAADVWDTVISNSKAIETMVNQELLRKKKTIESPREHILAVAIWVLARSPHDIKKAAASIGEEKTGEPSDYFTGELPGDVHVHILSFLAPRDVTSFGCVSKSCNAIVDCGETSMALWKKLWHRDYSWLVNSWDVGREAWQRSGTEPTFDKEFYFIFGQAWLNYLLAGQNTSERCLVGLHSNVYDITPFLFTHPGSPDTVMVNAGKDSTDFFNDVNHSMGARRLARSLCVVVDASTSGGHGVHPTSQTVAVGPLPPLVEESPVPGDREPRRPSTLHYVRQSFLRQQEHYQRKVARQFESENVLSHVNMYYDPCLRRWKAWYTNTNFEAVFIDTI